MTEERVPGSGFMGEQGGKADPAEPETDPTGEVQDDEVAGEGFSEEHADDVEEEVDEEVDDSDEEADDLTAS